MYKYNMIIDGSQYKALFTDHLEAKRFINEVKADNSIISVTSWSKVGKDDILNDDDFEYAYKVEMIAIMCLPLSEVKHKKVHELERKLWSMGIL